MKIFPLLLGTLPVIASAHLEGIPGAPKLVGGRGLAADLRASPVFAGPVAPDKRSPRRPAAKHRKIGGTSGQCGSGYDQPSHFSFDASYRKSQVDGYTASDLAPLDTAVLLEDGVGT